MFTPVFAAGARLQLLDMKRGLRKTPEWLLIGILSLFTVLATILSLLVSGRVLAVLWEFIDDLRLKAGLGAMESKDPWHTNRLIGHALGMVTLVIAGLVAAGLLWID